MSKEIPSSWPQLDFSFHAIQSMAFQSQAQEILLGGATRGGKTFFSKAFLITCCHNIPGIQCLVLRKYYDDVVLNFMEGHDGFRRVLAPFVEHGIVKITENTVRWLHTGSLITLTHCSSDEAAEKAQGIPKNILIVEEAPQILERYIRFIRGWVTIDETVKKAIPENFPITLPKIIYTGNPIGASMGYFRRAFVKAAPKGTLFTAPMEDGGFTRQYIEARVEDNPFEDTEATRRRVSGMGDPAYYEALCEANWDAPIGDFFKMYDDALHTVPDHTPPEHVFKYITFDWGSAEPFAVAWWYVSDGEEFETEDGKKIWTRRGCLVMYREWYGCATHDPAKGLDMPNKEIAAGIVERTKEATSGIVITDSLPFQTRGTYKNGRQYNIADEFEEEGVPLVRGNTQRIKGWKDVKDRLIGIDGFPMLVFQQSCKYARDYLPALQRHKTKTEDAEESGEATHMCLAGETLIMTTAGPHRIKNIRPGDFIVAGDGMLRQCSNAGMTKKKARVIELRFEDGSTIVCTPNHKFLTTNGWVPAIDMIGYVCIIGSWQTEHSSLMEKHIPYIPVRNTILGGRGVSMLQSGISLMGQCQKAIASIIRIGTEIIIGSKTWNVCPLEATQSYTQLNQTELQPVEEISNSQSRKLPSGIEATWGKNGTGKTTKQTSGISSILGFPVFVNAVGRILNRIMGDSDSAQINAKHKTLETKINTQRRRLALVAARRSMQTSTNQPRTAQNHALLRCVTKNSHHDIDVYCLTEPITHSFHLANGIVSNNSDIIRYACATNPEVKDKVVEEVKDFKVKELPSMDSIAARVVRRNNQRRQSGRRRSI